MMAAAPSGVVTFLFTDMEGSTRGSSSSFAASPALTSSAASKMPTVPPPARYQLANRALCDHAAQQTKDG